VETISEKTQTTVLLETMSGKGSEIGFCFDEISDVIKKSGIKNLGVCFDTCHVHDSGYNISDNLDRILYEFDKKVGIKKLKAVHLNDSKNPFGSRKDRHEKIGKGYIGEKTFERIVNHPDLKNLLFILETPNDMKGYAEEIALLKKLASTS
jgi:deoxyribonuclease-4